MSDCWARAGSQYWLQVAVNCRPDVINEAIKKAMNLDASDSIKWLSPLREHCFAEYRDCAFLERLGLDCLCPCLRHFWPKGGPSWDGLARTSGDRRILVEAKANIPELNSSPCKAEGDSLKKIKRALKETRSFLKVRSGANWKKCFYQYANRLAHLYFLKERHKVDAALVFVYFVGGTTRSAGLAVTRDGWETEIELVHSHLGLRPHAPWMRENVFDVFIDVDDLRC